LSFVRPDVNGIDTVCQEDIVQVLPTPNMSGGTVRVCFKMMQILI